MHASIRSRRVDSISYYVLLDGKATIVVTRALRDLVLVK